MPWPAHACFRRTPRDCFTAEIADRDGGKVNGGAYLHLVPDREDHVTPIGGLLARLLHEFGLMLLSWIFNQRVIKKKTMVSEHLWPEYRQPVSCSFICRYFSACIRLLCTMGACTQTNVPAAAALVIVQYCAYPRKIGSEVGG